MPRQHGRFRSPLLSTYGLPVSIVLPERVMAIAQVEAGSAASETSEATTDDNGADPNFVACPENEVQ